MSNATKAAEILIELDINHEDEDAVRQAVADAGLELTDAEFAEAVEAKIASDQEAAKQAAIVDAIGRLGPDDFTKAGRPSVPAVKKELGFDVTAKEVEAAFALFEDRQQDAPAKADVVTGEDALKILRKRGVKI